MEYRNNNWRNEAKCADPSYDADMWFADPAEEKAKDDVKRAREDMCTARDICRMCPAKADCLEFAMYRPFLQGIWGGLSSDERTTLRKVRARNDSTLVFGLFPEPDLAAYIGGSNLNKQSDAIVKALRARRVCRICGMEKDYYISRNLGRCRECALVQETQQVMEQ